VRLTKYQKARLLEYEWNVIVGDGDDNTCWLQFDKQDEPVLSRIKNILNIKSDSDAIKILVVATQTD